MESPLSEAELAQLEATLLPALERHHLRLLAHGLRTLQAIAGRREGEPPHLETIEAWARQQAAIAGDAPFIQAFAAQLQATGDQLQAIAASLPGSPAASLPGSPAASQPCSPLALDLPQLISWAQSQADARVR